MYFERNPNPKRALVRIDFTSRRIRQEKKTATNDNQRWRGGGEERKEGGKYDTG